MGKTTGARTGLATAALMLALAGPAAAQQAFIQLEAKRSQEEAERAAERLAAAVEDVTGYAAAGGWFVVAIGPMPEARARAELERLRAAGAVPRDAFLTEGDLYRRQFWSAVAAPEASPPTAARSTEVVRAPLDETVREARASEAALSREEKEVLQVALEWAGYYEGRIDASFGSGTRRAMAQWQAARGLEPTGVLTTAQREALLGEYDAIFDGLGMARVTEPEAGISIEMPTRAVRFEGRETPFSRYGPVEEDGAARVVLISREGDPVTLRALFEVVQTLDVVPLSDRHEFEGEAFRLRGSDEDRLVRGFARLRDGQIKGFILSWPAAEEERFNRLWVRMRGSFETDPAAVLGPEHQTPAAEQRLDRLAGLDVRAPVLARTGFFVDGDGAVLTTAEVSSASCREVLIDDAHPASVAWTDGRVALLRPVELLSPPRVASLAQEPPRLGAAIAVAGFPFGGALGEASLTPGTLEELAGLGGDGDLDRYALTFEEGDAGGPVFGPDGAVAGLLLAGDGDEAGERILPSGVAFGVDAERLAEILSLNEILPVTAVTAEATPERIAREGAELAVLVTCHG